VLLVRARDPAHVGGHRRRQHEHRPGAHVGEAADLRAVALHLILAASGRPRAEEHTERHEGRLKLRDRDQVPRARRASSQPAAMNPHCTMTRTVAAMGGAKTGSGRM
jgi:hypothetical protein